MGIEFIIEQKFQQYIPTYNSVLNNEGQNNNSLFVQLKTNNADRLL